ncbi:KIF19 [Branchiostoma lanceolatum]|uniref:Kinesin-like protein n=1 Tax=Branchiostoma lanceolatum TaxID=7740 RepID=A0A8J9VRU8_BRALA|nr:KIF19 [Branchiostoma lanceolatum]
MTASTNRPVTVGGKRDNLRVVVRMRGPHAQTTGTSTEPEKVTVHDNRTTVGVVRPSKETIDVSEDKSFKEKLFSFDRVFLEDSSQQDVYDATGADLVGRVFQGVNGCVLCYGHTSSGKTYTLLGPEQAARSQEDPAASEGLVPRTLVHMFAVKERLEQADPSRTVDIHMLVYEVYMEKVYDLFSATTGKSLDIRGPDKRGSFYPHGITNHYVLRAEAAMTVLRAAARSRREQRTKRNQRSSRSHMIIQMDVIQTKTVQWKASKQPLVRQDRAASLFMVDLAGSETEDDAALSDLTRAEGRKIRLSLYTLKRVVAALSHRKRGKHVPYRESVLTKLLKHCLDGTSQTVIVATCDRNSGSVLENISTLNFAQSCKKVSISPKANRNELSELLERTIRERDAWKRFAEGQGDTLRLKDGLLKDILPYLEEEAKVKGDGESGEREAVFIQRIQAALGGLTVQSGESELQTAGDDRSEYVPETEPDHKLPREEMQKMLRAVTEPAMHKQYSDRRLSQKTFTLSRGEDGGVEDTQAAGDGGGAEQPTRSNPVRRLLLCFRNSVTRKIFPQFRDDRPEGKGKAEKPPPAEPSPTRPEPDGASSAACPAAPHQHAEEQRSITISKQPDQ